MAVILPTFAKVHGPTGGIDAVVITWTNIGDTDTCLGVKRPDLIDRSFQAFGTFAGATILCQGSNDSADGAGGHWDNLTNPAGTVIAIAAEGIQQVLEASVWIRPKTTLGSGSSVTVAICARRSMRGG